MGKRSNEKRIERDFYPTPEKAVLPLLPYILNTGLIFAEPCAGDGALVDILEKHGMKCGWKSDIEPQHPSINKFDGLELKNIEKNTDIIITNPPWEKRKHKGEIFNKLLRHWLTLYEPEKYGKNHGDIWLLFDADWLHTQQAIEFEKYCKTVVSVGRVRWIEGSKHDGKDNCAWYCFNRNNKSGTRFKFRVKKNATK